MKNHRQHLLILFFFGSCFFLSCKKQPKEDKNILAIPLPPTDAEIAAYIPAKLSTGKSEVIFSYTAANVLAKIEYENGDSTVLKFNAAGKPERLKKFKEGILVSESYYSLNKDGSILRVEHFTVRPDRNRDFIDNFDLSYNSDGKVNRATYYDSGSKLLYEQQYAYGPTGNLISQTSTEAVLKADYIYDKKNALFKNVGYAWLFALEKENTLFLSSVNNIQDCSYPSNSTGNQTTTYVYNSADFPKTIISTVLGIKTTTTVTYK